MAITYQYKCNECKSEFIVKRRITETTTNCINCKSTKIQQIIKPSEFILKGKWFKNKGEY